MKDVVVMITITLSDESLNSQEFQDFLEEIKNGKMKEEMMSDLFQEIKIKYQVYKNRKPPQPNAGVIH